MKSRPCHRMKKSFYNLLKVRTALQQLCNTGIIVLKVFHQETRTKEFYIGMPQRNRKYRKQVDLNNMMMRMEKK